MTGSIDRIGPYRISGTLGKGGMGIVYKGEHAQTGESAAIKTVLSPHETILRNTRREIRSLARVHHPCIVRIVDEGLQDGLPWYAMDLIEGVSLRHYCSESFNPHVCQDNHDETIEDLQGDQTASHYYDHALQVKTDKLIHDHKENQDNETSFPIPGADDLNICGPASETVQRLLNVFRSICEALAFLHGEGIVHRDLKPDNILVKYTGLPVILDFGLTTRFSGEVSRESLLVEAGAMGTVLYMAPEQIRSQEVDSRADLYALGCMFYEFVTGKTPFSGSTIPEILNGHLHKSVVEPAKLVKTIHPDLNRLIVRLLAKNPRDRYGYAHDVATVLTQLGAKDTNNLERIETRSYLFRPDLVGRDEEISSLAEILEPCEHDLGGFQLIIGESGVGKTRLVKDFGRLVLQKQLTLLTGKCDDRKDMPLKIFRQPMRALVDRCRERGEAETERLFGKRVKILSKYFPFLSTLPGFDDSPEFELLPHDAARLQLFNYLIEILALRSLDSPLVFILDDLQWADDLSLEFLKYLFSENFFEKVPVVLICTCRTEEITSNIKNIINKPQCSIMHLPRLDENSVSLIISDMLALKNTPKSFSSFLSRHSEGNPFFIAEYLRVAVDENLLWRDREGHWRILDPDNRVATTNDYETLPLPHSLRELITRRIGGLSHGAVAVTEIMSVLGKETQFATLLHVTGYSENDLLDAVSEMLQKHIVKKLNDDEFRFIHDKIREYMLEKIPAHERRNMHQAVAENLEVLYSETRAEHYGELGYHREMCGHLEVAKDYYLKGARRNYDLFLYQESARLYQSYLRLEEENSLVWAETLYEYASEVLVRLRDDDTALSHIDEAFCAAEQAQGYELMALCSCSTAMIHCRNRQMDLAFSFYNRALTISQKHRLVSLEGSAFSGLGDVYSEQGLLDEASRYYVKALNKHKEADDELNLSMTLSNLALIYHHQGKLEQALTCYKESIDVLQQIGNRWFEGRAYSNYAALLQDLGKLDEAEEAFEKTLVIVREVDDYIFENMTMANLGFLYVLQGKVTKAHEILQECLIKTRESRDSWCEGLVLLYLTTLARLATKVHKTADRWIEKSLILLEEIQDYHYHTSALIEKGHCNLARQQSAENVIILIADQIKQLELGQDNELIVKFQNLKRAEHAFQNGKNELLYEGQLVEDLPPGLRDWLDKRKLL